MTSKPQIDEFLAQYPSDPERRYYETLCDFFGALNVERTEENGFACIMILDSGADIWLKDGRIVGDDDRMGSIEDISACIAFFFRNISADTIWWKANYPTRISDPAVGQSARALLNRIKTLKIVAKVKEYM